MDYLTFSPYDSSIKKNGKQTTNDSSLANRPLPSLDKNFEYKQVTINPTPSENINKSGFIPINTMYNEKNNDLLPVILKPGSNNEYLVLEDNIVSKDEHDKNITKKHEDNDGKKEDNPNKEDSQYKMNLSTQIYIGSLTIIGLFVFYRLIQKTK